ncbi:hypothetical protein SAMN05878482_10297 [Peribacillus simplex]|uniref:Uncharacterized protein n=1 Tax=Peribacillus simplex TaxID=1478 RepID=A0A9X8R6T7_9BACI|nr:hypothetical protein [Peribacillus simplex]SIQ73489.1 hypothetical protein SAMN05878482_10297 [Peribacillus simplex]
MNLVFKQIPLSFATNKITVKAKADDPTRLSTAFSRCCLQNEKLTISKHAQLRMTEYRNRTKNLGQNS